MEERFYCKPLKLNEDAEVMAIYDGFTGRETHTVENIVKLLNEFNKALVAEHKKCLKDEKDYKTIIKDYSKQLKGKDKQIKALNKIIAKLMKE